MKTDTKEENDLIVTDGFWDEVASYVAKYIAKAIEMENDAVWIFIPLKEIAEKCKRTKTTNTIKDEND